MKCSDILDFIFPRSCVGCSRPGRLLCSDCLEILSPLRDQDCPNCREVMHAGNFCSALCRAGYYFDQLIVCFDYHRPTYLKKLIGDFKYKFSVELAGLFGKFLQAQYLRLMDKRNSGDKLIVVPVPLHKRRLKYRGFNQAELLAKGLVSENKGQMILSNCLERVEYRPVQAKLSREERILNLNGSIQVSADFRQGLYGREVILVDDIATTCSTLNECSRSLREFGVINICCMTLARAKLFC